MKKIIALTLAIIMSISCFSLMSFAETTSSEHLTEVPEGYIGVYTKDDLDNIKLNKSENYILMNDIIFEKSDYEKGGSFYNSGKGWEPITYFSGILDGNGYAIKNLYVNNSNSDYMGFLGRSSGSIKNLHLSNVNIIGKDYVGGIVGHLTDNGSISNCIVDGDILGNTYVGGFCGYEEGCEAAYLYESFGANIEKSVNLSTVTGSRYVGGFAGYMDSGYRSFDGGVSADSYTANIKYCINSGEINGSYAGGIAGYCSGKLLAYRKWYYKSYIEYCYNTGRISGKENIGGISGDATYNGQIIKKCYSIGQISSETSLFAGISWSAFGEDYSYYLDESAIGGGSSLYGIAKSEDQLRKQTTYQGWDFDTVWTMDGREDYPYPELRDVPLSLPDDLKTAIDGTVTITGEAKVGSTLTADISGLVPADAELTYEWKADGVVVGTESTYTVTQEDVGKEITLTVKGNGDFKGEISSSATVAECVHELGEYTNNNDATCTKNETKTAVCSKCNQSVTEEIEDSKLPHSFTNYVSDENATCTANGTKTAKCDNCDATDTIEDAGTMKEHTYTSTITAATCTEAGKTDYVCTECGDTYSEPIDALDHDYSTEWTVDKAATCTAEGSKSHHCTRCDAKADVTAIATVPHSYTETVKQATCSEDGYLKRTCKNCGDTYNEVIPATGKHNDTNNDGKCDDCDKPLSSENPSTGKCDCMCHRSGIVAIFWKVVRVFYKIFRTNRICACGRAHY